MRMLTHLLLLLSTALVVHSLSSGFITYDQLGGKPYEISISNHQFLIDGTETILLSTTIDYFRVPIGMFLFLMNYLLLWIDLWETVVQKAKRDHFNVVQVPVHWNVHEDEQHEQIFEDNRNLFLFLEICKHNGMFVNIELGPYVSIFFNYGLAIILIIIVIMVIQDGFYLRMEIILNFITTL